MEIHATTTYNEDIYHELAQLAINSRKNVHIILYILIFLLIFFQIYLVQEHNLPVSDLISTIFVALIYTIFMFIVIPKRWLKLHKAKPDQVDSYTFSDSKIFIKSYSSASSINGTFNYSAINKVVEQENYIFIYIEKTRVLVIDKSTITGGTVENIRNVIISYIGINNYKI